jgi:hypothetical protein
MKEMSQPPDHVAPSDELPGFLICTYRAPPKELVTGRPPWDDKVDIGD